MSAPDMTIDELPEGWIAAPFSAVTVDPVQRVPASAEEILYIDIGSVDRDTKTITQPQTMFGKEAPSRARKVIKTGDVLVSTVRPNLNAVALVDQRYDGQFASTGFDVLRSPVLDPRWIFFSVRTPAFVERMTELVQGALYPAVRSKDVRAFTTPIAPLAEQKRIADKLEAVLGRVDACRARLAQVPALLKRFRQSVLTAATSGQLTEEWREDPGLASWTKKKLTDLGDLGRGKSKHRPRNDKRLYDGPYPFVQTGDVANSRGRITRHTQTYSEFGLAQSKLWPAGTVCITIAANIADTAILAYPACFPDSVVGFIANPSTCRPEFIKWTVDVIKEDLESFAPATAQKNINLGVLYEVEISCPPLSEQQEIVRRVEALFAYADRIEASLVTAQTIVERLTPATLAKAFRGELVPQNPDDEPAEKLLSRLRSQLSIANEKPIRQAAMKRRPTPTQAIVMIMKKTRFDDDVNGKPFLAAILRDSKQFLTAEELYNASGLPLVDFYKQLAWEVEHGMIRDNHTNLEPVT